MTENKSYKTVFSTAKSFQMRHFFKQLNNQNDLMFSH
jgi:hypothetical protein